jgi:hypothetical protein
MQFLELLDKQTWKHVIMVAIDTTTPGMFDCDICRISRVHLWNIIILGLVSFIHIRRNPSNI